MGTFGKAGKTTVHSDIGLVQVDLRKEEYLFYRLDAQGAEPIFTFSCEHKHRKAQGDFAGHPCARYEWTWCKDGDDSDNPQDMYGVLMSFLTAIKYVLRIEHRRKDDSTIKILKHIEYESNEPTDFFNEPIRIFTQK